MAFVYMATTAELDACDQKFARIKALRLDIRIILDELVGKHAALNQLYVEMVKTHGEQNYTFGLDAFYFQNKLLELEYENVEKIFIAIDNRMYCEYWKLYRMLLDYVSQELKEAKLVEKVELNRKNFPAYKDLDILKAYEFGLTTEVQGAIMWVIDELLAHLAEQTAALVEDKAQSEMGINIDSIIHVQQFNTALVRERITMFLRYLSGFDAHHFKYLSRLALKVKLMVGIVNEDIHLKQGVKKSGGPPPAKSSGRGGTFSRRASSIDLAEERSLKQYVSYETTDGALKGVFDTILGHIPSNVVIEE